MNSKQKLRIRAILILIIVAAGALASSLYWTQAVKGSSYAAQANRQYIKPTASLFDRGTIFFQAKDGTTVPAATVDSGFLVYINPTLLTGPAQAYEALSQYLTLDKADFMAKASKPHDVYEELAHKVDAVTAQSVASLGLAGVNVVKETWRSYPGGSLAAHEVGLIGEDASNTAEGTYGLERSYDDVLDRPSISGSINAFANLFSGLKASVTGSSEGDIITTIEPTVESYLESTLKKTKETWSSDEIGGIIMDPNTGEIVAMSSLPTFDPNDLSDLSNVSVLSNPLVEHVYEMGSIMKPLTMATALDTGTVTPDSTYDDVGCMTLDKKKICNYDGKARGVIPMQQILSQSLNIGAATIALKVGKDDMAKYFLSFGMGSTTGIDLPNEAKGIVGNLKEGKDIDIATAAYGQGIALSPVEMIRALSVLANGGYLVTPHVVKEIDYTDGTTKTMSTDKVGPLLKAGTADEVKKMLITVVDKTMALAHPNLEMANYTVAAKTGTAEIADHVHGGYYPDRYLHSFFGFFPAYDPKFVVFLYQVYPKNVEYASETLTDPFSDIEKFLINYYNIPPDR